MLKWAVRVHKWIALIIGIQILLWISGGLVMSVIPIEQVRGEHKVTPRQELTASPPSLISLEAASEVSGLSDITGARLDWLLDTPVWHLTGTEATSIVNAETGDLISPIGETIVREIADADYSGDAELVELTLLETSPSEYRRPAPVWRAKFNDLDRTTLYIDPKTAAVTARRSSTWRFYDFFWKLHVMDYDDGADFNHPLIITAAAVAILVAISGLILLIIKMRRSIMVWRNRSAKSI